jgi:hypothetical protein
VIFLKSEFHQNDFDDFLKFQKTSSKKTNNFQSSNILNSKIFKMNLFENWFLEFEIYLIFDFEIIVIDKRNDEVT